MCAYGAVENKPKGAVITGAVVGVALLAAVIGAVIYHQTSEQRRLDAMDEPALAAEYDALAAAAEPLRALADAATPATKPADFAGQLAAARAGYEHYTSPPRRTSPLPSGRRWPGEFETADRLLKDSLDHFGLVSYYLDQRAKAKPSKVSGTASSDADIQNVARQATDPLRDLLALLDRMRAQRDAHAWDYSPATKTKS